MRSVMLKLARCLPSGVGDRQDSSGFIGVANLDDAIVVVVVVVVVVVEVYALEVPIVVATGPVSAPENWFGSLITTLYFIILARRLPPPRAVDIHAHHRYLDIQLILALLLLSNSLV
jgi:hypothetical protein